MAAQKFQLMTCQQQLASNSFCPIHAFIPPIFLLLCFPAHTQLHLVLAHKKNPTQTKQKTQTHLKQEKRTDNRTNLVLFNNTLEQIRQVDWKETYWTYPQKIIPPSSSTRMFLCGKESLKFCISVLEAQERLLCFGPCCEND